MRNQIKSIKREFQTIFPYAIKRLDDGSSIALNRHYKPLGLGPTCGWIDYSEWTRYTFDEHSWIDVARSIGCELSNPETPDLIYLYDSNTKPCDSCTGRIATKNLKAYLAKLAVLHAIPRSVASQHLYYPYYPWLLQRSAQMDAIQRAMSSLGCDYDGAACPDANLWRLFEKVILE